MRVNNDLRLRIFFSVYKFLPYIYGIKVNKNRYKDFLVREILQNKLNKHYFIVSAKKKDIALASVEYLSWDSKIFGFPMAKIHFNMNSGIYSYIDECALGYNLLEAVLEFCKSRGFKYLICRVNSDALTTIHSLESADFRLIDAILKFKICLAGFKNLQKICPFKIRLFKKKDTPYLENICLSSFKYDRFHSDPLLPRRNSDFLHKQWLNNLCRDKRNMVAVAVINDIPIGFILLSELRQLKDIVNKRVFSIVLTAVRENFRSKGAGKALLTFALNKIKDKADICEVGTQINNIAACRLYESNGFKSTFSSFTFRRWIES